MNFVERLKGHFLTITHHRHEVMKYCFRLGLYKQGLLHDLSKYSPVEFLPGVKYFQGNKSPNHIQREVEGCSKAWLHHKGRNRHHFEYWIDYPGGDANSKTLSGMPMPTEYVVEMFCDRIAACKTYNKDKYTNSDPLMYFMRGKDNYVMHKDAFNLLYKLLLMLSKKGEKYTFAYIKHYILEKS